MEIQSLSKACRNGVPDTGKMKLNIVAIRKGGFFYDFTDFMDFTDFFCTFAAIIKKWAGLLQ
jgi:hypothetical protein